MCHRVLTVLVSLLIIATLANAQVTQSTEKLILKAINDLAYASQNKVHEIQQWLFTQGDKAAPFLIRALGANPNSKVRYRVALILGNMRYADAVKPLFVASQLDESEKVRRGARLGLENLVADLSQQRMTDVTYRNYGKVTRGMVLKIKRTLKKDSSEQRRIQAAEALGRFGEKDDIEDVIRMIPNEESREVKMAMLRCVERLAYPEMLEGNYRLIYYRKTAVPRSRFRMRLADSFLRIIADEDDEDVRKTAVESLTKLVYPIFTLGEGWLTGLPQFTGEHNYIIEEVAKRLLEMIEEARYSETRPVLIESVSKLLTAYFRRGDTGIEDELRRRLTTEVYDFSGEYSYGLLPYTVRMTYERNFSYTPLKKSSLADEARDVFLDVFLNDDEPENRRLAVEALTTLGRSADANDVIKGLSNEQNYEVWLAAVEALGRLERLSAAKWLYAVVKEKKAALPIRIKAVISIGLIDDYMVTRALTDIYRRSDEFELKKAIVEAMRFAKDEEIARFLVRVLHDENPQLRLSAVESLSENTYSGAVEKLEEIVMSDPDPEVKAAALVSLEKNDPKNAAQIIGRALNDEEAAVRRAAVVELGIMKEKKAAARLAEIMRTDPDKTVRLEAARSIGYLGDRFSVQPLLDTIVEDPSSEIQQEALRSLIMIHKPRFGIVAIMNMMPKLRRTNPEAVARLSEAEYYLRLQHEGYLRRD